MSAGNQGQRPESRYQELELDVDSCWSRLGSSGVGRFAFSSQGSLQILSVHYAVIGGELY